MSGNSLSSGSRWLCLAGSTVEKLTAQQAMPSCGVPGSSRIVYYAPDLDHLDRSQRYWSEGQDSKPAQGGDNDALYEENPLGAVDGGQGATDDCWQQ